MPKEYKCCLCFKHCKPNVRRHIPPGTAFKRYIERRTGLRTTPSDVICATCTARIYRSLPKHSKPTPQPTVTSQPQTDPDPDYCPPLERQSWSSPKSIPLSIPAATKSHKYCIVCHKEGNHRSRLTNVPEQACTQAFIQTGIFIYLKSRCCAHHLEQSYFNNQSLVLLGTTKSNDWFSRSDIVNLLSNIRVMMTHSYSRLNFDIPVALSDEDYFTLTGLTRNQFQDLTNNLTSLNNSPVRTVRTSLAVFLVKLRTGLSNRMIGVLFGLTGSQVQRIVHSVKDALMKDFVPHNLGFDHISHQDFSSNHLTDTAKSIFDVQENEAVVVIDGTYIYIQKSSDYKFQRRSYSLHKNRPLLKPMMIVATDGYILDSLGPYLADGKNNDAAITKHFMKTNNSAKTWFKDNDLFIVDRGFRDSVTFLEDLGFQVKMPSYLARGAKQHSTEEANLSRLVTKVRWIVESVNGRIKQWRFFDRVVPNTLVPFLGDLVRIVCSLCNKFREPLASKQNDENAKGIIQRMVDLSRQSNSLKSYLEENNLLNKRSMYKLLEATDLPDFPVLSLDDLRSITMGVYQVKQSPSYTKEHKDEDGSYQMFYAENEDIMKVKIQSRHSNSVQHTLWLRYDNDLAEPVKEWYCTCKVGARVVGCCAHVASVLWYLGYDRHQQNETKGPKVDVETILDASNVPETDSESSGSEDESHMEEE